MAVCYYSMGKEQSCDMNEFQYLPRSYYIGYLLEPTVHLQIQDCFSFKICFRYYEK